MILRIKKILPINNTGSLDTAKIELELESLTTQTD